MRRTWTLDFTSEYLNATEAEEASLKAESSYEAGTVWGYNEGRVRVKEEEEAEEQPAAKRTRRESQSATMKPPKEEIKFEEVQSTALTEERPPAGFSECRAATTPYRQSHLVHSQKTFSQRNFQLLAAMFAKKRRAKKKQFCLDVQEEYLMCDFIRNNASLWDIKRTDYRRVDKKTKLWEDQAKAMGKTVQHLQGWFKSLRDTHTRLHKKKKSGDGAPELTERERWVMANFSFLKTVVRHRAEPVNTVKEPVAAHSGDLEAACADIVVRYDSARPPPAPCSSLPKERRGREDEHFLQSLQKRVHESRELLNGLVPSQQQQPLTATAAFANYVRDCLVSMSKRKFRKVRSRINTILNELMDEESDE